jgi:hypothetical protein
MKVIRKNKVIYIFGAGASAQALPVVKDYSLAMWKLADEIEGRIIKFPNHKEFLKQIVEDLRWLYQRGVENQSIDGYCKFCCNKASWVDLQRAKTTIAFFFEYHQIIKGARDSRYNKFLHELLDDTQKFPDNVKMISWNYDRQLQIASLNYKNEAYYVRDAGADHIPSLFTYYPSVGDFNYENLSPSLIHMNGIAGYYYDTNDNRIYYLSMNRPKFTMEEFLTDFEKYIYKWSSLLTFAFENQSGSIKIDRKKHLNELVENTDIVVIIGYSFPSVNRNVDDELFAMLKKQGVRKIYIQDPSTEIIDLKDRFSLSDVEVVHHKNCDSFLVPYEINKNRPDKNPNGAKRFRDTHLN